MSRACFETPGDGLADVIQGLGFGAPLGNAARNGRALRNEHAGLVRLQRHKQLHTWILLHLASDDGASSGTKPELSKRYETNPPRHPKVRPSRLTTKLPNKPTVPKLARSRTNTHPPPVMACVAKPAVFTRLPPPQAGRSPVL